MRNVKDGVRGERASQQKLLMAVCCKHINKALTSKEILCTCPEKGERLPSRCSLHHNVNAAPLPPGATLPSFWPITAQRCTLRGTGAHPPFTAMWGSALPMLHEVLRVHSTETAPIQTLQDHGLLPGGKLSCSSSNTKHNAPFFTKAFATFLSLWLAGSLLLAFSLEQVIAWANIRAAPSDWLHFQIIRKALWAASILRDDIQGDTTLISLH